MESTATGSSLWVLRRIEASNGAIVTKSTCRMSKSNPNCANDFVRAVFS
jgi:hypothetical protein